MTGTPSRTAGPDADPPVCHVEVTAVTSEYVPRERGLTCFRPSDTLALRKRPPFGFSFPSENVMFPTHFLAQQVHAKQRLCSEQAAICMLQIRAAPKPDAAAGRSERPHANARSAAASSERIFLTAVVTQLEGERKLKFALEWSLDEEPAGTSCNEADRCAVQLHARARGGLCKRCCVTLSSMHMHAVQSAVTTCKVHA